MPRYKRPTKIGNNSLQIVPTEEQVIIFLRKNPRSRHNQISAHLKEKGITFADHKGLDNVLSKLQEKKWIKKNLKDVEGRFPTYKITEKGNTIMKLKADFLVDDFIDEIKTQIRNSNKNDKERMIEFIDAVGVYQTTVFSLAQEISFSDESEKLNF